MFDGYASIALGVLPIPIEEGVSKSTSSAQCCRYRIVKFHILLLILLVSFLFLSFLLLNKYKPLQEQELELAVVGLATFWMVALSFPKVDFSLQHFDDFPVARRSVSSFAWREVDADREF